MSQVFTCVNCFSPIPKDAPDLVCCPSCLFRFVLADGSSVANYADSSQKSLVDISEPENSHPPTFLPEDLQDVPTQVTTPIHRRLLDNSFGNYDLLGELGRGGMGVVYKARQKRADRIVALKVLLGTVAADRQARFEAEVRALARIVHPQIVPVYEVGEQNGCPFFSMEYMAGRSLAYRVHSRGPMPIAEAARIIEDLARAVVAAHQVGVLHRDIKPANVLLTEEGVPKLTDFGLAKHLDRTEDITMEGTVMGTPNYMAPEQADGKTNQIGPATDIYGLGATFYELLTGEPPYQEETPLKTLAAVVSTDLVPPRSLRIEIPPELDHICRKCLEKLPTNRYSSATELAEDLARWRNGEKITIPSVLSFASAWRTTKKRWKYLVAISLLIVFAVTTAAILQQLPSKSSSTNEVRTSIQEQLADGKTVQLLGATGLPKWYRWLGNPIALEQSEDLGPLMLQSVNETYLELLDQVPVKRYRFTVELQHHDNFLKHGMVGVYFSRKDLAKDQTHTVRRLTRISFQDVFRGDQTDPRTTTIHAEDILRVITPENSKVLGRMTKWDQVEIPWMGGGRAAGSCPWRKLEIQQTPEEVTISWLSTEGKWQSILSRTTIQEQLQTRIQHQKDLIEEFPDHPLIAPELTPNGGLGLFLWGAAGKFRHVTIEPY